MLKLYNIKDNIKHIKNKKMMYLKCGLLAAGIISLGANNTGCAKTVACDVATQHVHTYIDEENDLQKYILGEKDHKGKFSRTEEYVELNEELKTVCNNNLLLVSDNINYIINEMSSYSPRREEWNYDLRYGYHYGYGYNSNGEYGYGWVYGSYYDYDWDKIAIDEYTENPVHDITYNYKFYKINSDNTIEAKTFNSLDDRNADYKYFKSSDLINKNVSDKYYLKDRGLTK